MPDNDDSPLSRDSSNGLLSRRVKRLQSVDLMIDLAVFDVALRAAGVQVGDTVDGVSAGHQPTALLHGGQHLATEIHQLVAILQASEEQIAFLVQSAAQLNRVFLSIVRFP